MLSSFMQKVKNLPYSHDLSDCAWDGEYGIYTGYHEANGKWYATVLVKLRSAAFGNCDPRTIDGYETVYWIDRFNSWQNCENETENYLKQVFAHVTDKDDLVLIKKYFKGIFGVEIKILEPCIMSLLCIKSS